jgi:Domain of unknown function (DUF4347)
MFKIWHRADPLQRARHPVADCVRRTRPPLPCRAARDAQDLLGLHSNQSCETAAGPAGAAFIAGLAQASGVDIAAVTGLVGAAAQPVTSAWSLRIERPS